ncbi:MAG: tRNA epoxyqueuosine(34) reductase QueG [Deltaproteobacteria bacterium]|nr:MAG: tRNA epoxyqueuosine(34) reductase QueG [Deltaproteobacteria bacterium]
MTRILEPDLLEDLRRIAESAGVLRLSAVSLDHPGLAVAAAAFDAYIDEGRHGTMEFLVRSRAARHDPNLVLPGARSALVGVVPYGGVADPVARYAQHADYHTVVHRRLERVEARLLHRLPDVATRICVDTKPVMERALAALAGIGRLGKSGMLIVPGLGTYVVIGVILTTAEVSERERPYAREAFDVCGRCTACLDACPTKAFDGPGRLDARRCIAYLTIEHRGPIDPDLAVRMGVRVAGCDVCQEVCPHNTGPATAPRAPEHAYLPPPSDGFRRAEHPDVLEAWVGLRSGAYRRLVRGTALRRIPRHALRRNALLALAAASPPRHQLERALDAVRDAADPALAAAASTVRDRLVRGRERTAPEW